MRVPYDCSFRRADWFRLRLLRGQPHWHRCLDLHSFGLESLQSHCCLTSISKSVQMESWPLRCPNALPEPLPASRAEESGAETSPSGWTLSAEEFTAHRRSKLAGYKVPKAVEFGALPKTSTGKVQNFVLSDREWGNRHKRIKCTGAGSAHNRPTAPKRVACGPNSVMPLPPWFRDGTRVAGDEERLALCGCAVQESGLSL